MCIRDRAIDSPSGFTKKVTDYLLEEYARLGYSAKRTVKGGVIAEIGGEGDPILTMAHVDTLGAVVAEKMCIRDRYHVAASHILIVADR